MSDKVQKALEKRKWKKREEELKEVSPTYKESIDKVNAALTARKSRIKSKASTLATDIQERYNSELNAYKNYISNNNYDLNSGKWGKDIDVGGVLDKQRERLLSVSKLKRELETYRGYLDESVVDEALKNLNSISAGYQGILTNANTLSKFETEDEYNDAKKTSELYSMSSEEIAPHLDASKTDAERSALVSKQADIKERLKKLGNQTKGIGFKKKQELQKELNEVNRQIEELDSTSGIAYTTVGGQNITWQSLYDDKKAEEDFNTLYNDLSSKGDWELNSQYKPTYDKDSAWSMATDVDWEYEATNRTTGHGAASSGGSAVDNAGYADVTTDEEKAVFNYLYHTQGKETAMEWHKSREHIYKNRREGNAVTNAVKFAEDYPVLSDAIAIAGSVMSGGEYLAKFVTGNVGDTNQTASVSSAIKGTRMEQIDWEVGNWDVFDFLYGTGTSMIESATAMALFGGGGGVALGLSAAGQATNDALNRGMSKGQAFVSGVASGIFEGLFESWSIGAFGDLTKNLKRADFRNLAKYIGKNMWNNAKEETLTEIANIAYDTLINGEFSQAETSIRQLMANGVSEADAKKQVALELGGQIAEAGASGALMGLGFGAGGAISRTIQTAKEGKALKKTGEVDNLVNLGKSLGEGTESYDLANKINDKSSALAIGKLLGIAEDDVLSANKGDIVKSLERKGYDTEKANNLADLMLNPENSMYANSRGLTSEGKTYNDIVKNPNSTANQRTQAYLDILNSLEKAQESENSKSTPNVSTDPQADTEASPLTMTPYSQKYVDNAAKEFEAMGIPTEQARILAEKKLSAPTEGKSSSTKENIVESKYEVSAEGKTINTKTDEIVNIQNIAEISESGEANLTLDGGMVVKASDLSFGSDAEAIFVENISATKVGRKPISTNSANALYQAAMTALKANPNMSADKAMSLIKGLTESYIYGTYNLGRSKLTARNEDGSAMLFAGELSQEQRKFAYELGSQDSVSKTEADQKVIDDLVEKAKPKATKKSVGKVIFEDGAEVDESALTETQKANLNGIKILAEISSVEFHVFRSERKGNAFKYTMPDGTVTSANGWFVAGTNQIWVDLNAGNLGQGTMIRTAAHEISHYIKHWSPLKWRAMADLLMKSFAENGVDTESMLNRQIAKIKRRYKANKKAMPSESLLKDMAYEELVCDALSDMLTDGSIVNFIADVKAKDRNLAQKILDAIKSLLKKWGLIIDDYKGRDLDTAEAQALSQLEDTFKKLQEMYRDAFMDANEVVATIGSRNLTDFAEAKNTDGEALFQYRAMEEDESTYRDMLRKWGKMTDTQIDNLFATIDRAMDIIKDNLEILDYAWEADINDRAFSPVKPNSDSLYQVSLDFSTLCRKRILQQTIQAQLQEALNQPLSREEGIAIRDALIALQEEGRQIEVACALCYVESARMKSPAQIKKFLNNREAVIKDFFAGKSGGSIKDKIKQTEADVRARLYKENPNGIKGKDGSMLDPRTASLKAMPKKYADAIRDAKKGAKESYKPTTEEQRLIDVAKGMTVSDFTSPEGLENLAKNYPALFDAYTSYVRNATKSKGIEGDTWWRAGDSQKIGDVLIANMNKENGLRSQSWSDFQVIHILDYIAATIELSTRNAKEQAYSKVPDYVELMGQTGVMINMSLIPTREFNGKLDYDSVEGMAYKRALELREKYPATAGTICIGVDNKQIQMLLADSTIDYVIPYHKSGMAASIRKLMHIPTWSQYEEYQSEKNLSDTEAKKNADKYGVKLLDKSDPNYHKHTAFSEWFDLEVANQIVKMENANPSNKAMQKKYGVMYGGYMAMQNAANNYLKLCAERGIAPKFSHEKADFTAEDNYWKLLIDRKMVNNATGEIIEQQTIKPIFDEGEVLRILNDELERYPSVKADQDYATRKVTEKFLSGEIKSGMSAEAIAEVMKKPVDNITGTNILSSLSEFNKPRRLTELDLSEYLKAGTRQNKAKQQALKEGKKIILTNEDEITDYISASISGNKSLTIVAYGRVTDRLAVDVEEYSKGNIIIEDNFLELVPDDIDHAYREHLKAKEPGDIDLTYEDFENIPEYIDNYDDLVYAIRFKNGNTRICVSKKLANGRVLLIETVSKSRGSVEFKNMIGVSNEKYVNKYEKVYKKRNSTNTRGSKSSNISLHDETVSEDIITNPEEEVKEKSENLFSERDYAPTFYSQMGKVIEGVKQEKLGANSVVNMLRGKGVKAEEIRWSGIVPFLEGKKSVTKQELLNFINGSMLQIGEQMVADEDNADIVLHQSPQPDVKVLYIDGKMEDIFRRNEYGQWVSDSFGDVFFDEQEILDQIKSDYARNVANTNWSQYKLDGGTNYREIVFTMPNSTYSNKAMRGHWGMEAKGILAHARIQDFEVDGKKMLFIEEIQSDWHNEGRRKGYFSQDAYNLKTSKGKELIANIERETRNLIDFLETDGKKLVSACMDYYGISNKQQAVNNIVFVGNQISFLENVEGYETLVKYKENLADLRQQSIDNESIGKNKVPDAPFKDNYHEYVLKRLLRMAAEQGYDSIGWTPAEIQSKRWSDEYAEGYRIEYDQDMPKFLKKYGRQWGAKVDKTTLENGNEIWSMDITDSMKESVLYEGQVMYSERDFPNNAEEIAKNRFGTTNKWSETGWLLKDGTQLDFSGRHWQNYPEFEIDLDESFYYGKRNMEHYEIAEAFPEYRDATNMAHRSEILGKFLTRGNIRVVGKGSVDILTMPTDEQFEKLRKYFKENTGEVIVVGIDNDGLQFEAGTNASIIVESIRDYFLKGKHHRSDLMRFHGDIFSERDSSTSNRAILANALDGVAQNDIEKNKLAEYKKKISLIESEEQRLSEIQKQLFTKGAVEPTERKDLQFEAKQIANRINTYDRQLLNLESTTALKNVLNREKALAMKRQKQKDNEYLKQYKEKVAKTTKELITRNQESRKKAIEGREKTAMRYKIQKVVSELNTLLTRGNKKKHIAEDLKVAVAEVLELFNMDYIGADERVAKYEALIAKATDPDVIASLTETRDRIQAQGDKFNARLSKLKTAYDAVKNSADPEIAGGFDEVVSRKIEVVAEKVGKTSLRNMTLEQLELVYDVYTMVLNNIREANSLFKKGKAETIQNYASRVVGEVKMIGGEHEFTSPRTYHVKEFLWNNLKPIYAFGKIGSETLIELFEDVRSGEDTWAVDITDAKKFSDGKREKYNYKKWDFDKKYNFKSSTGEQFSLTLEQILSLYAYSKRPQAADHLRIGGFVFDDSITTYKEKENGKKSKLKYRVNIASAHQISIDTLGDIIGNLTDEQKAFVDEMQSYLSNVMGAKGNEVSMTLYNIKLFKEKFYFPLKSAKQFMFEQNEVAGEVKIKNSGFTEGTVERANNPIILNNFMDVWANHVNDMSMYHSFVIPLENFNRVFNYQTKRAEGMPPVSVKETLQNAYGTHAVSYIRQLLTDLNGGARSDQRESTSKKFISMFKKAKVFASASVVIQQPSAVARALALIDAKYFDFNPKLIKHKDLWEEVKKYAPVAIIKEMGHFDTDMGMSTVDYIKGEKTLMQKADDLLSKAPSYADELTWVHIWEAVKRETKSKHKDLKVGSEEFLQAVGKRFTEVVFKTQVYDSVLARSANMRSKSMAMGMITAFMAEPTTAINMVEQGVRLWNRGYKRLALKQLRAVGASVILNAALVSLVYAMRDDDEDETYLEKYLGSFVSETIDGFIPLTYYPIVKDVWSLMQGYSVERTDMSLFSDAIDAMTGIVQTFAKYDKDMTDEEMQEFKQGMLDSSLKFVDGIASMFGVPVSNIRRDVDSVINTIKTAHNGFSTSGLSLKNELVESVKDITPVWGWLPGKQKQDKLYDAIVNGDTDYLKRLKSGYKDDKAYETAVRKALRENDSRIREAAEARIYGDIAEYGRIVKEIKAEGFFSQDTIVASVNAEINAINKGESSSTNSTTEDKESSIYKMDDYYASIVGGDEASAYVVKEDIINIDVANGKDRDEAEDNFNSRFASHLRKRYEDGYISEDEAKDMLINYGDKSEEDANSKVQYWAFKKEYPDYDDLSEEAVTKYYDKVESYGISIDVYYDYSKQRSKCKGTDNNGDGKTDSGSVKAEVLKVINSLPLTYAQKDALYYLNGWSAKTIYEAPWH